MNTLFTSVQIGATVLTNRVVMAPMTRSRADDAGVPGELVARYYGQRATAGLIITEGVYPSAVGKGYVRTPGIHSVEQVAAWRQVTDAVHAQGGKIFMQLMHCGRISHPSMQPDGEIPLAPSAIRPAGQLWTEQGQQDFVTPREMTIADIAATIEEFRLATRNALAAGFDGVELHAASGYLPEQFLSSGSNQRKDNYGGSVANRVRFVHAVLAAMAAEAGGARVGLKISPEMGFNDIRDDNPQETYTTLVDAIAGLGLAYLHVTLFGAQTDYHALLRPRFQGAYLIGGGLDRNKAEALLETGAADATVFGSSFIANPDLPARLRQGAALAQADRASFYSPGAAGYTDYPALAG